MSSEHDTTPQTTPEAPKDNDWFIPEDGRAYLSQLFGDLKAPVTLELFTRQGENDPYNDYAHKFLRDLARLSDNIRVTEASLDDARAKERGADRSPTVVLGPERYAIRFVGAPLGEEGRSFIMALVLVSQGAAGLPSALQALLDGLEEERRVDVFVSPTCPYCPGQVINAVRCAVARPDKVTVRVVEIGEHQDLAEEFGVGSVPHTYVNESFSMLGLYPEDRFVAELVSLVQTEPEVHDHGHGHDHDHGPKLVDVDLAIVGAGPAGLTAAIYAERAGLKSVVLEKSVIGGQVAVTPVVENYPGFANVAGKKLMDIVAEHARQYATVVEGAAVSELKVGKRLEVYTDKAVFLAKAVILCTGASWRKLGVPGEDRYWGYGVNSCASCDGYMYKGKKVAIVGGGNTALTDALHLKNLGVDLTLIHRRDSFRAQQYLQEAVARENIPVIWNTRVLEVLGDERVSGLRLLTEDADGSREHEMAVDGVFLAIGEDPNTQLAKDIGVALDEAGNIKVDRAQRTNIPRVYAAGDVTGGVRQIVTAIGEGSVAAMSAFEDMAK